MKIGYAHVSTREQNLDMQISAVAWRHIHFQGYLPFSDTTVIDLDAIIQKLSLK